MNRTDGKLTGSLSLMRDRLRWLIRFGRLTRCEIAALSERQRQELRQTVWRFSQRMTSGGDDDLSIAQITELATTIGSGMRALMRGEPWSFPTGRLRFSLQLNGPKAERSYVASHKDGFLLAAFEVIASQAKRLRQCEWHDCNNLFAATRRQIFCTIACSQSARNARFLSRHAAEERRDKRHAHYVRQVRKLKGAAVAKKVKRIPRRSPGNVSQTSTK
jgi:hypothetical protein